MGSKTKKAAKAPTKTDLKAKEAARLSTAEGKMVAKHGDKIVVGSVRREASGKISVEICTRGLDGDYDGNTRRVATSDVHQVSHMPDVKAELDRLRSTEKRAARKPKAAKPAAKGKRARKGKAVAKAS